MTKCSKYMAAVMIVYVALINGCATSTSWPITEAESGMAVFVEGSRPASESSLIVAAWPDGKIVWSLDRVNGGPPYYSGKVEPTRVGALLDQFERDGLFSDKDLKTPRRGPDASYTVLSVRFEGKQMRMESWHEMYEDSEQNIVGSDGIVSLAGRHRLEALKAEPKDYLFYRFVWLEVRSRIIDLIPDKGVLAADGLEIVDGGLLWHEQKSND